MTKPVQFRPEGFHTVNPYLLVEGADRVLDFLIAAFGAVPVGERFRGPDGKVMHAAVRIGDSMVEVSDAPGEAMPGSLHMYIEDTDATYRRAMAAGGKALREPLTTFYGDRSAAIVDPGGNSWWIATHIEDVSDEEVARRMNAKKQ
jgi:uncharacterized glyoxalase superfamily protein PhnB